MDWGDTWKKISNLQLGAERHMHACCAGSVEGFAVSSSGKASLLWSAAFPPSQEAFLGLAAPAANAPIYSYAKASPQRHPVHLVVCRPCVWVHRDMECKAPL